MQLHGAAGRDRVSLKVEGMTSLLGNFQDGAGLCEEAAVQINAEGFH